MKILVAVPTFENICPEVFKAIYDMDKGDHQVDFDFVKGYDCANARNRIAQKAIDGGYDYVMMIDSDTVVPKNALLDMLDPATDVVLGCCPRKNTKIKQAPMSPLTCKDLSQCLYYDKDLQGTERIELRVGGFACALIKVCIFESFKSPYFVFETHPDLSILSEDYYFCLKAVSYGFHIQADPRVKCGHLARYFQYE